MQFKESLPPGYVPDDAAKSSVATLRGTFSDQRPIRFLPGDSEMAERQFLIFPSHRDAACSLINPVMGLKGPSSGFAIAIGGTIDEPSVP